MTKREFVSITLRLMAVYASVLAINNAVLSVAQMIAVPTSLPPIVGTPPQVKFALILPIFAQIGIAIFLWLFAEGVAKAIVCEDGIFAGGVSFHEVKSLVFSAMGIWFFIHALVDLVNYVVYRSFDNSPVYSESIAMFYAAIAQIIVSLLLIFGARNVFRVLASPRDWGRNQEIN